MGETSWTLKDSKNKQVMKRKYLINFYENEHTLCLKSDECYEWTLSDEYNDGMCDEKCGSYSFDLNGKEILSGNGNFKAKKIEKFCTGDGGDTPVSNPTEPPASTPVTAPSPDTFAPTSATEFCKDDENFQFKNNPNKTCGNWLANGTRKDIRKKCKKKWNNLRIYKWCPKTCGEQGLGFCDFLE